MVGLEGVKELELLGAAEIHDVAGGAAAARVICLLEAGKVAGQQVFLGHGGCG